MTSTTEEVRTIGPHYTLIELTSEIAMRHTSDLNTLAKIVSGESKDHPWYYYQDALRNHDAFVCVATPKRGQGGAQIVGMVWLVCNKIPCGIRCWIEDVAVMPEHQGHGIAQRLLAMTIKKAREHRAEYILLTSSERREAARHVYSKAGFEIKNTDVWRLKL